MEKYIENSVRELKLEVEIKSYLKWINSITNAEYVNLHQLASGAVYCQILHTLDPTCIDLTEIHTGNSSKSLDSISNLKLLENGLTKMGVKIKMDVVKLAKVYNSKMHIAFLKWFKTFYERKIEQSDSGLVNHNEITKKVLREVAKINEELPCLKAQTKDKFDNFDDYIFWKMKNLNFQDSSSSSYALEKPSAGRLFNNDLKNCYSSDLKSNDFFNEQNENSRLSKFVSSFDSKRINDFPTDFITQNDEKSWFVNDICSPKIPKAPSTFTPEHKSSGIEVKNWAKPSKMKSLQSIQCDETNYIKAYYEENLNHSILMARKRMAARIEKAKKAGSDAYRQSGYTPI